MNNGKIRVTQHYDFFKNVKVVRSYAEIENISKEKMGLEYAASFCLYGFDINKENGKFVKADSKTVWGRF